ncbi:MAG: rod shape-determining protein RodA [Candidatus Doudnabacteria bacterium RIFCSPLOWO2_02_FULL_49_13]|uniref:Peptidoglycan glycosyltransferase RodA n=1 Tax=Candidatus Doudnabacteria bacterium RIFCSPHIGHO2_12_FULL_48_16 TaxID=1817838 RepID=A0A1F5PLA2_9BACT|nr:MAG: rod shape-determining protein RodA [Candidatus Doudnabacteria bacterium RIFCSPHIGHO2_02_FULL_49_24]OGE88792.1 MAG: rod shape-determining protein RodA [Candidatus Doudnabacteria bacterium RIFCSPHIGHO2_01_FULL_50_67]OGE90686.1 MAG: rod shape-determining protein RodA [Candidatus Doudnabacteria bacterium RIFCSPHIGHO2_12_FULL_48_16]OGE97017.1 MAG: rod shape-determining protein RodA [Candidatus Doudnabacteria bacterium RIFCSPLOWO2_01_FULL_49_40]OGF02551.1 MAG: rod shape-determining protein Ro
MRNWLSGFKYFDLYIFSSSSLLLVLGLLMIYSTTLNSPTNLLGRQSVYAVLGFVALFAVAFFDYRKLKKTTGVLYIITVLLLIAVWLFGRNIQGSTRWIDLWIFRLQPAEFAKLFMVIIMAKFLDQSGEKIKSLWYVLLSAVYVAVPAGLILIEPDLGTSLVLFLTWLCMLLFSRMNKKHLAILALIAVVLGVFGWFFVLHDYQKNRIYTFLDPQADPRGRGYNVIQSIIAVGSGSMTGRGVGRGLQSQLKFLPERQTDFIFASTAEELGLVGSLFILTMFGVMFARIIKACKLARDNFGMYLTLGIFFMLLIQFLINIGMNVGLMPVTGIPLPLLSYGGSSLITTMLALGLVQSVIARQRAVRFD